MSQSLSEENIKRFAEVAATWDENPQRRETAHAVAAAIAKQVELGKSLTALEFGCGTGLVTLALAPQLHRIVAVDSSPEMLAVLRQKIAARQVDNVTPMLIDISRESLPPQQFDLIYSSMTLHHIAEIAPLLRLFHGALKSGGHLAIADLDKEDGKFHATSEGIAHHGFEREALATTFTAAGFVHVQSVTAHVIRKSDAQGQLQEFPIFLMTAQKL